LPATVRLAIVLKKGKQDDRGLVNAAEPALFHVRTSMTNVDRAVSIVEAFLVAAADRGFTTAKGPSHLALMVDGEAIALALRENNKRMPHVMTAEEVDRQAHHDKAQRANKWELAFHYHRLPDWDYHATGQLFLEIGDQRHLGICTRWSDTATRPLESMLNDVLAGIAAYAVALREEHEKHERWRRERELEQQREAETWARAALEKARIAFLEERLKAFEEMGRLDRFLGQLTTSSHWHEPPPRFAEFTQWAAKRVQQLRQHYSAAGLQ
jgi:hypothetical protein